MYDSITEHLLIMSTTCNISPTFGALLARSLRWKREEGVQGASLTQPLNHNQHCSVGRAQFCIFFQAEVKIVKTPQAMDLSFEMFFRTRVLTPHSQVFTNSNEAGPVQVILPNHRLQYTKDEEGKYSAFISELYHFVPSVCDLLSSVILRLIFSCLDVFWQLICSAQGHGTDLRTAWSAGHGLHCGGSHASVSA